MRENNLYYHLDFQYPYDVIMDRKSRLIRRYVSHSSDGIDDYVSMEYDDRNRLTYIKSLEDDGHRFDWWRIVYGDDDKIILYEDYLGNCWKVEWDVPFLHMKEVKFMYQCEAYYIEEVIASMLNWKQLYTIKEDLILPLYSNKGRYPKIQP